MRIVFPLWDMRRISGGNRMLAMLGNGLSERNHKVTFVILDQRGLGTLAFPVQGDVIWARPLCGSSSTLIGILALAKHIPPCDVIVANYCMTAYAAFLSKKKGLPVYLTFDDESLYWGPARPCRNTVEYVAYRMKYLVPYILAKYSYTLPMPLLTISQSSREKLFRKCGRDSMIVHPGLNTDLFRPRPRQKGNSCKKLLWVGDGSWRKGLRYCLQALELVAAEQPEIELILVCSRPSNVVTSFPCRVFSNVSDEELAELYTSADVFVHSSLFEGFGMPALEAMAFGTPVVATDSGGVREFIVDGENALLVPPRDSHKLARAILRLLRDNDLARRLGRAGVRTAENFTWQATQDAFEKAILQIKSLAFPI